jgi:C-terminal processing protease CtpA/Prc
MKNSFIVILSFLLLQFQSYAQNNISFDNGSNIEIQNLSETQLINLDLLGRVWGFLKYYHPEIGKGKYNWDYELFKILPKYQKTISNAERDQALISWIDMLGEVKPCKRCKEVAKDAVLKPDLNWIESEKISKNLKEKLLYIQKNRHQGNHYYIKMAAVGNPEFKNENIYANMVYPDDGFRLLSLYRYWNMINYFFPYKHVIDKNWNSCLIEYIPKFIEAKNELEYELAAIQIIAEVKDTHANLWGGTNNKMHEQRGWNFPLFHLKFIENKLVINVFFDDEKAKTTGLELGDIITHINAKSVDSLVKNMCKFYPASNQPTRLRDISFDILRSTNSTLDATISRNGKNFDKTLYLYHKKDIKGYYSWYKIEKDKPSFKILDNNIGYITLKNITQNDVKTIKEELKNTKGIIVDIRNYPSAFMPYSLGRFFTSKVSPFVKLTKGSIDYPGEFIFAKESSIHPANEFFKGKVVILVNEVTQSQGEYTAMAFRAGDNVTIIGSTTAGADGNTSKIYLPGGLMTMISGIGIYYPDGSETQRVGIIPDVEVLPTIEGIKQDRDEVLEKAIEIINKSQK